MAPLLGPLAALGKPGHVSPRRQVKAHPGVPTQPQPYSFPHPKHGAEPAAHRRRSRPRLPLAMHRALAEARIEVPKTIPSLHTPPHQALARAGFPRGAATPRRCRLAPLRATRGGKPRHHHVSVGTSPPPVPQSHGAGSLPDPGVDSGWMRLMLALMVTQSPRHRAGERPAGTDPCSTSGTPCARSATSRPRTGAAFPSPVPGLGRAGSWQTGDHLPAARDGWGRVFWRHLLPRRPRQRSG